MTWKTIEDVGYIFKKNHLPENNEAQKANQFLQEVTRYFAQSCTDFYNIVGRLPFVYRERQIQSILLPAIAKVSDAVIVEQPITRIVNENEQIGRLDYWVLYQKLVFLIEVKHSWVSAKSGKVRKDTKEKWVTAQHQLASISKQDGVRLSSKSEGLLKMVILILPCYQAANEGKKLHYIDKTEISPMYNTLNQNLTPTPNWHSIWSLHPSLQKNHYYGARIEIYPAVFIPVTVELVN